LAVAVVPERVPLEAARLGRKVAHRGRAAPLFQVEPGGRLARRQFSEPFAHLVGYAAGHVDAADDALVELLDPRANQRAGAALRAVLDDAAVFPGGGHRLAAFEDVV